MELDAVPATRISFVALLKVRLSGPALSVTFCTVDPGGRCGIFRKETIDWSWMEGCHKTMTYFNMSPFASSTSISRLLMHPSSDVLILSCRLHICLGTSGE